MLSLTEDNRLKVTQVTAPSKNPVTKTEAENQLKLDSDQASADSDLVDRLIVAATNWAQNYLNRQLITATYEVYYNNFLEPLILWYPPIQSVEHLKYKDNNGNTQTVSSDKYVVDTYVQPGEISRSDDKTWPSDLYNEVNVVWAKYKAGYGDSADDVPEDIRSAILMKIGQLYENRTTGIEEKVSAADNLLHPYRVRLL